MKNFLNKQMKLKQLRVEEMTQRKPAFAFQSVLKLSNCSLSKTQRSHFAAVKR